MLCRSCIIGIIVLLVLKTGNGNPIYVNVSSTLMINRATSLTIAVKFLTSLSRRRLSRSKASAFSVLACKENIRNVNSHQEDLENWFKSDYKFLAYVKHAFFGNANILVAPFFKSSL